MLELIAVSVSRLIMTLYLTAYICAAGLPASISATYYRTRRKRLFPTAISLTGIFALAPLLNHTPESYQFVASAPAFKEEMVGKIHAVAASVLGVCAVTWLILTTGCPWEALVGLAVGAFDRKHFLFWVEVGLLYNLFVSLMMVVA